MLPEVRLILESAITAASLKSKITVPDFANAIFVYTATGKVGNSEEEIVQKPWYEYDIIPENIFGYFKTFVRHLFCKRKFMVYMLGTEPINCNYRFDSIEAQEEGCRSLEETLSDEETDNSSEISSKKINEFKDILQQLYDKDPKKGELLKRYYLQGESAESIAVDFLKRGMMSYRPREDGSFSSDQIEAACRNVQNSMLPNARKKFNDFALNSKYKMKLEGKIKKSIIKKIN